MKNLFYNILLMKNIYDEINDFLKNINNTIIIINLNHIMQQF